MILRLAIFLLGYAALLLVPVGAASRVAESGGTLIIAKRNKNT